MRREPSPHALRRTGTAGRAIRAHIARCGAAGSPIPTPRRKSRSPAAGGSTCNAPSTPCSWLPGARCCQRNRKRMKSAVVTGSISRRRRPSVRRWMRASTRRLHHSVSSAALSGLEAAAQDLAFGFEPRQARVHQLTAQAPGVRRAREPSSDRWIRTSRAGSQRRRSAVRRPSPKCAARAMPALLGRGPQDSAASCSRTVITRRAAASSSNHACHSGNGRQRDQRQQRVVQFVGVANHRPGFRRHLRDRRRIQRAHSVGADPAACAASARRARGALRAAHRPDRRTDWRSESRARTATARRVDGHVADRRPRSMPSRIRLRPSRSIASCRQLSMVSSTSG